VVESVCITYIPPPPLAGAAVGKGRNARAQQRRPSCLLGPIANPRILIDPQDAAALGMFSNRLTVDVDDGSVLLCLALGSRTGWALHDQGATVSGTMEFRQGRFGGPGSRYVRFQRWLAQVSSTTSRAPLRGNVGFDAIYFVATREHLEPEAGQIHGAFLGALMLWCEEHRVPYRGLPVHPERDKESNALALLQSVLIHGGAA
jgi:hypothetical protein